MRSVTRIVIAIAAAAALAAPIAALAMTRGGPAARSAPSFTREVAPVIADKCAGCHRVGGIAPFPLETASQIRLQASAIEDAVSERLMPPWPPGTRSPAYVGQDTRILSAQQRATILAWARAGGRTDGPARRPAAPKGPEVRTGETLLNLRMQATYKPSAPKGVTDDYRCFLVDPHRAADCVRDVCSHRFRASRRSSTT